MLFAINLKKKKSPPSVFMHPLDLGEYCKSKESLIFPLFFLIFIFYFPGCNIFDWKGYVTVKKLSVMESN